jgi:hypothetical protein
VSISELLLSFGEVELVLAVNVYVRSLIAGSHVAILFFGSINRIAIA